MLKFIPLPAHGNLQAAALPVETLDAERWLSNPESPISPQRRTHALQYLRTADRQRSLGATLVIDHLLRPYALSEKEMEYGEEMPGHKPCFLRYPQLHFNVSHSGKYAAGALASFPVGIDIEKIIPYDEGVAQICMSPEERAEMCAASPLADFDRIFITAWCLKEALLKAVGTGICEDRFPRISFEDGAPRLADRRYPDFTAYVFQIEDYMGALAYQNQ